LGALPRAVAGERRCGPQSFVPPVEKSVRITDRQKGSLRDEEGEAMRRPSLRKLFRVLNTLEDGRKLYLSTQGKVLVMPRPEADFWINVARRVHSIEIDEMVYSKDLRLYDHRSYFLERLEPFVRVVKTMPEQANVAVDPEAFIIGGILAARVDHQFRPQRDYSNTLLIIC
jgi:hypothetical protein